MEEATRLMFTRILATLARSLRDEELSVAQAAALHLAYEKELSVGQLGESLGLTMPSTSRMVDDLVKRGWLEREEHPDDRRVRVLRVSKAGAAFVERASE